MSLNAHGKIEFKWQDSVLILKTFGPFNEEGISEAMVSLQKIVLSKNLAHWSRIEILDENTLGSPETISLVEKFYRWCDNNGCRHTAIVTKTLLLKRVIENSLNNEYRFFDSFEQAASWINQVSAN